jgi:hypothetical protein
LHACVNCRYFDPAARWECRTEIAQRVLGKATANRCPAYAAKVALEQGEESKDDDPRAAFDALFR